MEGISDAGGSLLSVIPGVESAKDNDHKPGHASSEASVPRAEAKGRSAESIREETAFAKRQPHPSNHRSAIASVGIDSAANPHRVAMGKGDKEDLFP